MSSIHRTRSLRKPTIPPPAEKTAKSATADAARSGSPSRLPVKPSTRPASVALSSSSTNSTTATASRSSRPVSTAPSRSASTSRKTNGASAPETSKKETSRYPPLSNTSRATARTRPTSAGGGHAEPARRAPKHVRAKSTVTGLTAATLLLPPSSERGGNSGQTTTAQPGHGQTLSVDKSPSTPAKQSVGPEAKTQAEARPRPAFSTLQQHYSPAKSQAPKPLTSAILAPPSPSKRPANVAASAETSRLQAELLQLHLLHRDSQAARAQWHASAKSKLGSRFEQLSRESRGVSDREQLVVESDNILALRRWARGGKCGIEEKVQSLDEIFTELWALSEPAGRYARVVRRFERWVGHMCDAEEARHDAGKMLVQGQDSLFIGELDATWKEECAGLARRLEYWGARLAEIDHVPTQEGAVTCEASSLERMLAGAGHLVHDMLAELRAMEDIEQQALAREDEWIARVNSEDDDDIDTPRAGAIWRLI
ncbi:hypothetical protein NOR_08716 [Metarhizium rileyi]|uniref:Aga1 a-agglutinin anchor subunit n=1 Tax=Metarhizium rileyi (strain RCEF 4871) TaxID=1649241 RepID=A0A166VTJ2_METRR|nr:hypothetical protein NOR_08716 [Metarhizium rileyi RCEF 4871]